MRTILAIAGLLLASLSLAQGIPSDASGVYLTPDRVCRLVLARYQVSWIRADLTCLEFNGALSNAATACALTFGEIRRHLFSGLVQPGRTPSS